jgi:hypothetical protein
VVQASCEQTPICPDGKPLAGGSIAAPPPRIDAFATRCISVSRSEEDKPDDAKYDSGQGNTEVQDHKDAGPRFGLSRLNRRLNNPAVFICRHPDASRPGSTNQFRSS